MGKVVSLDSSHGWVWSSDLVNQPWRLGPVSLVVVQSRATTRTCMWRTLCCECDECMSVLHLPVLYCLSLYPDLCFKLHVHLVWTIINCFLLSSSPLMQLPTLVCFLWLEASVQWGALEGPIFATFNVNRWTWSWQPLLTCIIAYTLMW